MIECDSMICSKDPIFDTKHRNRPPKCGDCGGNMVKATKEYASNKTYSVPVLLCIKCNHYCHMRHIIKKQERLQELNDTVDKMHRSGRWKNGGIQELV